MRPVVAPHGVAASALRFYERLGLLRPLGRAGGMRVYDEGALEQVALIDLLKLSGLGLREIGEVVAPDGSARPGWRAVADAKLIELDARLRKLAAAREALAHLVACPHERLDDCPVHRRLVQGHAAQMGPAT